jgi:hypothetical protein
MKQTNLFSKGILSGNDDIKYTSKIKVPIYKPKNKKPHILELYDRNKTVRLMQEIDKSSLPLEEKKFLMNAAYRHIIFNYEKIADYYAHSSREMQELMEKSGLVIIDFNKAIQYGYVKLYDDIRKQYLEDYNE